jgi:hypothetical protein
VLGGGYIGGIGISSRDEEEGRADGTVWYGIRRNGGRKQSKYFRRRINDEGNASVAGSLMVERSHESNDVLGFV